MSRSDELRAAAAEVWEAQHAHPFVRGIGDGTLDEERFRFYVRQDYLFLIDYGRLLSLGAARAYCDFLLRTASLGDFAELCAALLPCMWGYAEIGARLAAEGTPSHSGYTAWIATYADPEFQELAGWARELVDGAGGSLDRIAAAFRTSSELELAFWEAAWNCGIEGSGSGR